MPVSTSSCGHGTFTATIQARAHLPAGTLLLIPMIMAMLSEKFWGKDTYEFNHKRENLCPSVWLSILSASDRMDAYAPARLCTMLTDVLVVAAAASQ
jgi:hypothetical protein